MNQSPLRIHSSISSQTEDNDKLCELFLRLITKVTVQRVQWQSHQPLPCLTTNVKTQAKWNNKLTNNSFGRSRTLQHKQKTLTITWIIHLSDCPRRLQHKHKQWQTRLVGNYLTNLLQSLPSMTKRSCDQISNLTLMNIIEKKYYQFLDMQTLQHKQEKIIIQWINHLSTDPEHDKQSLGIYFILFR